MCRREYLLTILILSGLSPSRSLFEHDSVTLFDLMLKPVIAYRMTIATRSLNEVDILIRELISE